MDNTLISGELFKVLQLLMKSTLSFQRCILSSGAMAPEETLNDEVVGNPAMMIRCPVFSLYQLLAADNTRACPEAEEDVMDLGYAIIFVKDMERMLYFYGEQMGLPLIKERSKKGWVEFATGGTILALHAVPEELAEKIVIGDPPCPREETPIKLVFLADNVEQERSLLLERGVHMLKLLPWGACNGLDPEGNVFQIAQR